MRSEWILREISHDYCLKALSLENFSDECGPAAWKLYEMILGFFLQVVELKRESKILVQIYPTKFISALKFFKTTFLEMREP